MDVAALLILVTGAFPLWSAWRANRRTALLHAVQWTIAAWLAWTLMALGAVVAGETVRLHLVRYVALCMTGCAGVAVLGARRPGVHAWSFVVLALLAVMLLPLAENLLPGAPLLDTLRLVFLTTILSVGIVNYLPTRLACAMGLLFLGCTYEILTLAQPTGLLARWGSNGSPGWILLGLAPWAGYAAWRMWPWPPAEFDRLWTDFRNRFGLFWGQRVREQFNNAACHAGWPAHLYWQGLLLTQTHAPADEPLHKEMTDGLRALLKRFFDA